MEKLNKNVSLREYNGSLDCDRQLYQKGGISNLYQGFGNISKQRKFVNVINNGK